MPLGSWEWVKVPTFLVEEAVLEEWKRMKLECNITSLDLKFLVFVMNTISTSSVLDGSLLTLKGF
jgi:hypothetical protein